MQCVISTTRRSNSPHANNLTTICSRGWSWSERLSLLRIFNSPVLNALAFMWSPYCHHQAALRWQSAAVLLLPEFLCLSCSAEKLRWERRNFILIVSPLLLGVNTATPSELIATLLKDNSFWTTYRRGQKLNP